MLWRLKPPKNRWIDGSWRIGQRNLFAGGLRYRLPESRGLGTPADKPWLPGGFFNYI
jgi:hypothetical protein